MRQEIVQFVDGLSEEEEDRVLTGKMGLCAIGESAFRGGGGCLVQVAKANRHAWMESVKAAFAYDSCCDADYSFATINAEIRDRIWSNRAARMPAPQPLESPKVLCALTH